ncbi:MAG: polysaccharide deacetylase family protein [Oricola sp.]
MSVIKTFMRKAFMNGARYSGLSALLSPVLSGVGGILMLHHVGPERGGSGLNGLLHIEPEFLDRLLDELKDSGARFVSMDEAADRLKRGHFDERFLTVTLDDGYRDNLVHAAPVFRAHGVPFAIYVSPGLTEGSADLWWELLEKVVEKSDEVSFETTEGTVAYSCRTGREKHLAFDQLMDFALTGMDEDEQRSFVRMLCDSYGVDRAAHARGSLLDRDELRKLAADPLATLGAHTINHFQLRRLTAERAFEEMARSRDVLGDWLGGKPRHFAYPYGGPEAVGPREVEIAREIGFETAVTTRHGMLMPAHAQHLHALPRISVNGCYQRVEYVETMLTGITMPAANHGRTFITV